MGDPSAEFVNTIRGQNPDRCKSELLEHSDRCRNYCCYTDRPQIDRHFWNYEIGHYENAQTDRLE